MIVQRIAQTDNAAGVILAVDGQPDGTVARKRFWRGNFLFAQDRALGGPGFKRFRPVVVANGAMRRLSNAEIAIVDGNHGVVGVTPVRAGPVDLMIRRACAHKCLDEAT